MPRYKDHPKFAPADTVFKIAGAREALEVVPRSASPKTEMLATMLDRYLVLAEETARELSVEVDRAVEADGYVIERPEDVAA